MLTTRKAEVRDVKRITEIYNQGIEDRIATLETRLREKVEMRVWLVKRNDRHRVLVLENEEGNVLGWAALNVFNSRDCYSGVADVSIYIERASRGKGLGRLLLGELIKAASEEGFHKMVLSTFKFNEAGQRLYKSMGFREVGTYEKQGLLDGEWVDVTIMERILA